MQAVAHIETSLAPGDASAEQLTAWLTDLGRHHDRGAFEALFAHFAPRIKSYMLRLGTEAACAEDLAQETMVQVWRKAALYDPAKALPTTWVFTVARNLRLDRLRKRSLHTVDLQDAIAQPDDRHGDQDRANTRLDADRLARLIRTLPADQIEVVHLSFFEGLSHAEIVDRLEVPLGTVKSRLRLAFRKLRASMEEPS